MLGHFRPVCANRISMCELTENGHFRQFSPVWLMCALRNARPGPRPFSGDGRPLSGDGDPFGGPRRPISTSPLQV